MIKNQDFLISQPGGPEGPARARQTAAARPLTDGIWQSEALETARMFGNNEGGFSPVLGQQLTLFDMPASTVAPVAKLDLDAPNISIPHWDSLRFLAKETQHQVSHPKGVYPGAPVQPSHARDAATATQGELLRDGVTALKADEFPGRVDYTGGGLYPAGSKTDPAVIAQHRNAPNYRRMQNRPVHGVGQPTRQGFQDVLTHLGARDKPVVWTNMRAEAVLYIGGEPYNLRELASRENLVLKEGASGAEVEALEEQLKQRVIQRGNLQVPIEPTPTPPASATRTVSVTPENVQTTQDVIADMRAQGFQVEYKRIPVPDEMSPDPARLDEIRSWMNDVQARHPEQRDQLDYVFNCHQGRGRTTTAMVAAGIALEGQTKQLELPLGLPPGETAERRADRVIDEAYHMQNLRESVNETRATASGYRTRAEGLEEQARQAPTEEARRPLEAQARAARADEAKYDQRATEFTRRYALMQKYSDYIDRFGAHCEQPNFEQWMGQTAQTGDLNQKWAALNLELGLSQPEQLRQLGLGGRQDVALA